MNVLELLAEVLNSLDLMVWQDTEKLEFKVEECVKLDSPIAWVNPIKSYWVVSRVDDAQKSIDISFQEDYVEVTCNMSCLSEECVNVIGQAVAYITDRHVIAEGNSSTFSITKVEWELEDKLEEIVESIRKRVKGKR